jgi:signal transduction histidine kinase
VPPTPPPARDWRLTPAISLAIWTVPTLLSTLETVAFASQAGRPIALWRAFVGEAPQWYGWALFTPMIVALGDRFPLRRPVRARSVLVHVGAALLVGAVTAVADAVVNAWVRPSPRPLLLSIEGWFLSALPATALAYAVVVGVSHVLATAARLRERERRAAELETQLRDAQLAALRMQLQPHFLFNSLNAIMALVRDQDTPRAVRALSLLSDVLRAGVNAGEGGGHETTLAQELDFVSRYLAIERVRFGDRLRVVIDVPTQLGGARVPTFVLQPFVENALKHGVLRERAGNTITIAASRDNGTLRLSVRDDGRGLPNAPEPGGVGIANARARLDRMYGGAARLSVANAPDGPGVAVNIAIPYAP